MMPEPLPSTIIADLPASPQAEKRTTADRRCRPTGISGALPPAGSRVRNRRAEEHCRPYFVDRFSPAMLLVILLLLIASMVDAVLTLRLIEAGASEVNPLMKLAISKGVTVFLAAKYIMTAAGLPLLVIFKNYYLFGTRLRVGHLIPVGVALYAVLIAYQLVLMKQHM